MKIMIVLNGKKAGLAELRNDISIFREEQSDVHIRVTYEYGDVARFLDEAVKNSVDRFIIGGGDGSVNEAIDALAKLPKKKRPLLAILPLGTANDFARACTIPLGSLEALRFAASASPTLIDIAKANDRHFINMATAGFGAKVTAETPVELKNFLGGGAYTLTGVLKALDFIPYKSKIVTPNHELDLQGIFAGAICNGRQAGGGQVLAPLAMINDGLLDIISILEFKLIDIPQVLWEIQNPSANGQFIKYLQTPWVECSAHGDIPVNLDGEPYHNSNIRFEIIPSEIDLIIPKDAPCLI
ncbi:Transcription regulator [contains diacylglycerol kinase catalytic domain] [hydrothermal vent metagenome]|uniref:Transcription regulator [contains diacylglycerol kinase catalytic domain] n=1 Tax=hydrothermal vent metagenome TaxID=652676 RepID=A0A1W1EE28_9ZZZZ